MSEVILALLIGIPGSGKTHFSNILLNSEARLLVNNNYLQLKRYNMIHVCYDLIIPLMKQKEIALQASVSTNEGLWKQTRGEVFDKVQELVTLLIAGPCNSTSLAKFLSNYNFVFKFPTNNVNKYVILLDDNFYYRSMRYQFYSLAYKYKISFCQLYFQCPLQASLVNNAKRDQLQQVPNEVIDKMIAKIQPPLSDNSWEVHSISYTVSETSNLQEELLESFLKLLDRSLTSPADTIADEATRKAGESLRTESRLICSKSTVHQCDLILRSIVGDTLKNSSGPRATIAKNANLARQFVLSKVKSGELTLHDNALDPNNKSDLVNCLHISFVQKFELLST